MGKSCPLPWNKIWVAIVLGILKHGCHFFCNLCLSNELTSTVGHGWQVAPQVRKRLIHTLTLATAKKQSQKMKKIKSEHHFSHQCNKSQTSFIITCQNIHSISQNPRIAYYLPKKTTLYNGVILNSKPSVSVRTWYYNTRTWWHQLSKCDKTTKKKSVIPT